MSSQPNRTERSPSGLRQLKRANSHRDDDEEVKGYERTTSTHELRAAAARAHLQRKHEAEKEEQRIRDGLSHKAASGSPIGIFRKRSSLNRKSSSPEVRYSTFLGMDECYTELQEVDDTDDDSRPFSPTPHDCWNDVKAKLRLHPFFGEHEIDPSVLDSIGSFTREEVFALLNMCEVTDATLRAKVEVHWVLQRKNLLSAHQKIKDNGSSGNMQSTLMMARQQQHEEDAPKDAAVADDADTAKKETVECLTATTPSRGWEIVVFLLFLCSFLLIFSADL